ncbi:MAG: hypothetical protein GXY47_08780 [Acidobacteria bacterium]|nr:hypothetical protein [Acidobacteriota bacterium]
MKLFRAASKRGPGLAAAFRPFPLLLGLMLLVETCALPIPAAFLLISADAAAVTDGCDTGSCCTALCYVDGHGVHHCVHKHGAGCGHGAEPEPSDSVSVLLMTLAVCPEAQPPLPGLESAGVVSRVRVLRASHDPAIPIPPPK